MGEPARQPATYLRHGTAKLLTLFHPASGQVRVQGVTSSRNAVLYPWLQQELSAVLASLPEPSTTLKADTARQLWHRLQQGLTVRFTLPQQPPSLRMLLNLYNLKGHKSSDFVLWLVANGIMPLYTPLSGSWLNMAESMQRILAQRALAGQYPQSPEDIMHWLEAAAQAWNQDLTPFEWQGKRADRRRHSRLRRRTLSGSGACVRRAVVRGSHALALLRPVGAPAGVRTLAFPIEGRRGSWESTTGYRLLRQTGYDQRQVHVEEGRSRHSAAADR